jgi:hypothetical protein
MFSRRRLLLAGLAAIPALTGGCPARRGPETRAQATGAGWPAIPPVRGSPAELGLSRAVPPRCPPLLRSFFLGGFESASHLRDGRHLDLTASTRHDQFAELDYRRLTEVGIWSCRDGVSWPVSEPRPGEFDFSRVVAMAQAARRQGVQVIWSLMHYGWPLDLDVYATAFPGRFARYARAWLQVMVDEGLAEPGMIIAPVNEISFLAWAGGDVAMLNPFQREHSTDLKYQLVRAAIESIHAMREVLPSARFIHIDPLMNVAARGDRPKEAEGAEDVRLFQFQALHMMLGRTWGPQLGGSPDLVDLIGVNYYRNNQRYLDGEFIEGTEPRYRPLSEMLLEVWERYHKPLLLSETGAEDEDRPQWLRYVCMESAAAIRAGCPLHGVTWYPIVNHPGWADDRHIHNGLWDYPDDSGHRERYDPLAEELMAAAEPLTQLRDRYVLGKEDCNTL